MADISLKTYLERVDTLLRTSKYDEVVAHSRHILKFYPRNVDANRLLGLALVQGTGVEEGKTILKRVLAVFPDDVDAHIGLSEANERTSQTDLAIWHMERAFEQAPGEKALHDRLRSLYQRHRGIDDPKLQLTTGAVAHQYIRNGLYNQAIDTLLGTLERSPNRIDLRLLLAQTLWRAGKEVEAAETAIDVLEALPYCLEANRMMTALWLSEQRPSDAQRYLEQIQEVEPYTALQLAQGDTPDADVFLLPELDYRRIQESQLATEEPDWLHDIDEQPEFGAETVDTADVMDEQVEIPESTGHTGYTGLLTALDGGQDADEEIVDEEAIQSEELPDWLAEAAPSEITSDELPDFELEEAGEALDFDFDTTGDTDHTLDWLQEASPTSGDSAPDFFAELSGDTDDLPMQGDSLAWLEGSGVELADSDELPDPEFVNDEDMVFADPEAQDPMAWLTGSGAEASPESASSEAQNIPAADAQTDDDGLAWLDQDVPDFFGELDEEQPESETTPAQNVPTTSETAIEEDNLDWLEDDTLLDEFMDIEELSTAEGTPTEADNIAASLIPDEMVQASQRVTDLLSGSPGADFLSEPEQNESEWQNIMSEHDNTPSDQPDENFDWLNEMPDEEGEPESTPAASGEPGWLSEEAANDLEDDFGWLSEDDTTQEDVSAAQPNAEMPDWLSEAAPVSETEPQSEGDSFDWMADDADEETETEFAAQPSAEMPDWLSEAAPVSETEPQSEGDNFDWMADDADEEAGTEFVAPISETEPQSDEDSTSWMDEDVGDYEQAVVQEIQAAGDDFNWSPESTQDTDTPDWLTEVAAVTGHAEETREPVVDTANTEPDDLTQINGIGKKMSAALMDAGINTFAKLAQSTEDELGEAISAAGMRFAPNMSTWPGQAAYAAVGDWDGLQAYLDPDIDEMPPQPQAQVEGPDDVSEMLAEAVPLVNAEPDDGTFDWLAETEEEPAQPAGTTILSDEPFEWAEETPEDEGEPQAEIPYAAVGQTRILSDYEDDATGEPDWLSETESDELEEALPYAAVAQTRILSDYEDDEDYRANQQENYIADEGLMPGDDELERALASAATPPPATNAPDWLNAMVPGLDLDYEATADDEPLESSYVHSPARREMPVEPNDRPRNYDWLVDIVDEETGPIQAITDFDEPRPTRRRFVFTRQPAWLRTSTEPEEPDDDFELPEWLQ